MADRQFLNPSDMHQKPDRPFSLGVKVRADSLVFVSGQTARDSDGNTVGIGDIKAQTRQIMENIGKVLRDAGGTHDDIVKLTMFVTDLAQLPAAIEARSEYLKENKPASASVQTVLRPDALIEIEAIAAVPADSAGSVDAPATIPTERPDAT